MGMGFVRLAEGATCLSAGALNLVAAVRAAWSLCMILLSTAA